MTKLLRPRFIALCGYPKSGKSEVQKILDETYKILPVDDGFPLRDFAMRHLGADQEQVYTQEGKASFAFINGQPAIDKRDGKHLTWREVLGRLGNQIEALFGDEIIGEMAIQQAQTLGYEKQAEFFSFGSVRKTQGNAYKRAGGIVIEIERPGYGWNGNDFDRYDTTIVDKTIINATDIEGLHRATHALMKDLGFQQKSASFLSRLKAA